MIPEGREKQTDPEDKNVLHVGMKKRAARALCAIILVSLTAIGVCGVGLPAARAEGVDIETALAGGYDVYAAWYLRNRMDYDGVLEKGSVARILYDNVNSDIWQRRLAEWKLLNFSIKNALNTDDKEIGYYETKLLNILYSTMSEDCTPVWLKAYNGIAKNADEYAKARSAGTIKNLCELLEKPMEQSIVANLDIHTDTDTVNKYIDKLWELDEYKDAMKAVSDVSKYFSYCKTFSDLLIKIEKIQVLSEQQADMRWLLSDMNGLVDGRDNGALHIALRDFANAFSGEFTEDQINAIFTGKKALALLIEEASDKLWKYCLDKLNGYGVAIKAGQGLGKMNADILFNTSNVITQFYKLEAIMNLENVFRDEVYAREKAFQANPTPENARKFIYAFCMLLNAFQEGDDTVIDYLNASFNEGALNDVRKFIEEQQKEWRDASGKQSDFERCEEEKAFVLSQKDDTASLMSDFEHIVYNSFVEELLLRPELGADQLDFTRVEGDIVTSENAPYDLRGLQFDGANASVYTDTTFEGQYIFPGDLTLESGHLDMNCFRTVVRGDLYINSGRMDLNGNVLTVFGNIYHRGGEIRLGEGSIICAGSYMMVGADSDLTLGWERYTPSRGTLYMNNGWDTVAVRGRMIWNSVIGHDEHTMSNGVLYVAGDMQKYGNGHFSPAAEHLTVFNGRQKQVVFHDENSEFGSVRFDNPDIEFRKYVKWKRLVGRLPANLNDAALYDDSLPGAESGANSEALRAASADIQPGQMVEFGMYAPYDGMVGTERLPVRWLVLDKKEDTVLLLSEKVLFACVMDNGRDIFDDPARWNECTLRTWHLQDFYDQAFALEERNAIVKSTLPNDCGETEDGVFILSAEEVEYYLPTQEERVAHATPSAMIRGWLEVNNGDCAYWWTRSDDGDGHFAYVRPDGLINESGEAGTYSFYGIRPAMWVKAIAVTSLPEDEAAVQPSTEEQMLEGLLLDTYQGDGELLTFCCADYDGDGAQEAFALLGNYDDENFDNLAEVWFVCAEKAVRCERAGGCYPNDCFTVTHDERLCFQVSEGYFGSGGALRYWTVEGGKPYLLDGEYMMDDLREVR